MSAIPDTQVSSLRGLSGSPVRRRTQVDGGPIRTLAVHLTCVWKTPCRRGGGPWALGDGPGERVSRYPCSGDPLGQVLSRGGIPGPGGIIILIRIALGESGAWVEPRPVSGPCCCSRLPFQNLLE